MDEKGQALFEEVQRIRTGLDTVKEEMETFRAETDQYQIHSSVLGALQQGREEIDAMGKELFQEVNQIRGSIVSMPAPKFLDSASRADSPPEKGEEADADRILREIQGVQTMIESFRAEADQYQIHNSVLAALAQSNREMDEKGQALFEEVQRIRTGLDTVKEEMETFRAETDQYQIHSSVLGALQQGREEIDAMGKELFQEVNQIRGTIIAMPAPELSQEDFSKPLGLKHSGVAPQSRNNDDLVATLEKTLRDAGFFNLLEDVQRNRSSSLQSIEVPVVSELSTEIASLQKVIKEVCVGLSGLRSTRLDEVLECLSEMQIAIRELHRHR